MSDVPASASALRKLIGNPDFFKSAGDLISLAEALSAATTDQVNGITRKRIDAAQTRLTQLSKLNEVSTKLKTLAPVDANTRALGPDRASSDALVADLNTAGVSLATGTSYYLSSVTTDSTGKPIGTQPNHIATEGEKTVAEAGTLIATDASGNETRSVPLLFGNTAYYTLRKNDTVLTASVADVTTAASDASALIAPLLVTVANDMLTIKAFLAEKQPLKDNQQFTDARNAEGKSVDNHLAEFVALAKVAAQRAQERRDEGNAPSRAPN